MIEFSNGMVIRYDGKYNWSIAEKKVSKTTGKAYISGIAFYGSLKMCLEMFIERDGLNVCMEEIHSLQSIIDNIESFKKIVIDGLDSYKNNKQKGEINADK